MRRGVLQTCGVSLEVRGDAVAVNPALFSLLGRKRYHDDEGDESENESRSGKRHHRFPRFMIVPTIWELGLIEAERQLSNGCRETKNGVFRSLYCCGSSEGEAVLHPNLIVAFLLADSVSLTVSLEQPDDLSRCRRFHQLFLPQMGYWGRVGRVRTVDVRASFGMF